jgi:hypothetical protein
VTEKAGVADPDGRYGLGVLWTDVDADGWPDLYVANDSGPNFLYHNQHDGTFREIGFQAAVAVNADGKEQASMGVAAGDYLHTGRLALFVSNFEDEYDTLYRHDEPLMFTDVSYASGIARAMGPYVGWGTAFLDYDNDGWPDLIVVNGHVYPQVDQIEAGSKYAQRILLFHNNRNGSFSEVAAQTGEALIVPRVSRGAAFGDIDNDGDIDVVINNLNGKPTILRNDGGNRNNWITIKTVGAGRNRDALGTRLKVVSGDLVQWDEVHSGGSYLSALRTRKAQTSGLDRGPLAGRRHRNCPECSGQPVPDGRGRERAGGASACSSAVTRKSVRDYERAPFFCTVASDSRIPSCVLLTGRTQQIVVALRAAEFTAWWLSSIAFASFQILWLAESPRSPCPFAFLDWS